MAIPTTDIRKSNGLLYSSRCVHKNITWLNDVAFMAQCDDCHMFLDTFDGQWVKDL